MDGYVLYSYIVIGTLTFYFEVGPLGHQYSMSSLGFFAILCLVPLSVAFVSLACSYVRLD